MIALWLVGLAAAHPDGQVEVEVLSRALAAPCTGPGCPSTGSTCELIARRGAAHAKAEHHEEALADLRAARACALTVEDARALDRDVALLVHRHGDHPAAIPLLREVLTLDPADRPARLALALSLAETGAQAEADAAFEEALADVPVPTPEWIVAWAGARRALGDPAGALEVVDLGLSRGGPSPALRQLAVSLELERGHPEAALARLDEALLTSPRAVPLVRWKAEILRAAGRSEEARAAFEAAEAIEAALPPRVRASGRNSRAGPPARPATADPAGGVPSKGEGS